MWLAWVLGFLFFFASAPSSIAAEPDALAISANIQANHLPYGTIIDPVYAAPDSDQLVGYSRCADSAIWTGHYLAAEAFRYKVTNSADALANVKAAIAGIQSLVDVTGNNLLARCMVPLNSPYAQYITQAESANGIHTNMSAGYYWVGNTSRDEYSGVMFGLAVAYDMVGDTSIQTSISSLVTLLVDFLMGHNWSVVMPDGSISTSFLLRPDQILSFIAVGRHVNSSHFSTVANDVQETLLSATTLAPIGVDVQSNDSYFKFNLDAINLYNLVRLDTGTFSSIYKEAYSIYWNYVKGQQNAFFNMIDRALNGPDSTRDPQTVTMLDQWLQRPKRDPYVDLTGQFPSCSTGEACNPIPVPLRPTTDFLWQRDPFMLMGGGYDTIEGAGIDYILPYWMARYYNVVNAASVVSAASQRSLVAPEAIASFYGMNLASGSATAGAGSLPTTLGGIGIQVQDSAGVTRPAPLSYVSSTQINFEIPAGTALGEATFSVTNGGATALGSGTANLINVAPSLFTADGSGGGVAAALAIQVSASGQQSATPIFQCANGTCSSIPINLGVDPYLSLYGTGIRNLSSLSNVSVTIDGMSVPVLFAGAQGGFEGLDQVNVTLPVSLSGTGETNLILTVDGQTANTVQVNIQ